MITASFWLISDGMLIKNLSATHTRTDDKMSLVMDRQFMDMSEYGQTVGWDLDFRQLDPGRLQARAALLASPGAISLRVEFNRKFHQAGGPPKGQWTFGFPDPEVGDFRWCGTEARGGGILNFNQGAGFEGSSPAGFSGFTLSFDDGFLRSAAQLTGHSSRWTEAARNYSCWSGVAHRTDALRGKLTRLMANHAMGRGMAPAETPVQLLAAELILDTLSGQAGGPSVCDGNSRRRTARKAAELLHDATLAPQTVAELCRMLGVSGPTLYRGFMEEFGVSPKQYLKARLLNGVRGDLLASGTGTKVHEVANRWGFWHMGQFSRDYRQHFEELPSQTLKNGTHSR